jgi:hypothetical protein
MPHYQRYQLPAIKPCTATFLYSINIHPKVSRGIEKKKQIQRSNSLYDLYTPKK